jgi:hypothetical protein
MLRMSSEQPIAMVTDKAVEYDWNPKIDSSPAMFELSPIKVKKEKFLKEGKSLQL